MEQWDNNPEYGAEKKPDSAERAFRPEKGRRQEGEGTFLPPDMEQYREDMKRTLQELIAIRSVVSDPVRDREEGLLPFGRGVHEAFQYVLKKAQEDGFETEDTDHYGGHVEFGGLLRDAAGEVSGTSDQILGILVHLDTVPEGKPEQWTRPPFSGAVSDGKLYGRGAIDNKGPAVAAYFAMKALKEAGFVPEKKVRLLIGLDEETRWEGMEYYLKRQKAPDLGFAPDAEFPVIHGEKGILIFELAKKLSKPRAGGLELRSVTGGSAANMVADQARALLRGPAETYGEIRRKAEAFRNETGFRLQVRGIGKSLEITAHGVSAHGARPHLGENAISILMAFLGRLPLAGEDAADFIAFYNERIGFELDGKSLGCAMEDPPSGQLVLNVGTVHIDGEAARIGVNIRYPVTAGEDQVYDRIKEPADRHNLGILKLKHSPPLYFPEEHPMIRTLMEIYRKHTGDRESRPRVIGGGTYARAAANMVAFGAVFPGEPETAHQKDEYISLDNMVRMAAIYADAIVALSPRDAVFPPAAERDGAGHS